jgi:phosphatidyl-myo-inositol dimannoside synthase
VTNDLPPASGGIQQFVGSLLARTADSSTLVLGPPPPPGLEAEARAFDAAGPWRTLRAPSALLPGPRSLRWLRHALADEDPDVVIVGSLWPLGLLSGPLRTAARAPLLGITHGAEAGLGRRPLQPLLRAVTREADLVTVITAFTAGRIGTVVPSGRLLRLTPGVDLERFRPVPSAISGAPARPAEALALRAAWGVVPSAPLVGCIARLVPRKGQDVLLQAWPAVREAVPDAHLVLVGEGPRHRRLARAATHLAGVTLAGRVPWDLLPAAYAALDVFAMPVRTRLLGLDVEGFGISLVEAQACGVPVVAGMSGGTVETLPDQRAGSLVDGRDVAAVATALVRWLRDPQARALAAQAGPTAAERWSWDAVASELHDAVARLAADHGRDS